MDSSDLLKATLPWIGTALGGPLGTGIASFIADKLGTTSTGVKDTLTAMIGDPTKIAEAQKLEAETKAHLQELGYSHLEKIEEFNVRAIEAVNKTMQTEAASDHWPTYGWRPFIGFSFGAYINAQWLLPLAKLPQPTIDPTLVTAIGAILGVASWFRGKMQADPQVNSDNRG